MGDGRWGPTATGFCTLISAERYLLVNHASASPQIGTLAEKSLHADLKVWYAASGDRSEVAVDGFVVDLVRDAVLIEIQTRHLGGMKRKLVRLLEDHHVVNRGEGREQLCPLILREYRPQGTLEKPNRCITVQADDQQVTQRPRLLQQAGMSPVA